jgi:hypothetical protein
VEPPRLVLVSVGHRFGIGFPARLASPSKYACEIHLVLIGSSINLTEIIDSPVIVVIIDTSVELFI